MDEISNGIKILAKKLGNFFKGFFKWKIRIAIIILLFIFLIVLIWWSGIKISAGSSGEAAKNIAEGTYSEGNIIKIPDDVYEKIKKTLREKGLNPDSLYLGEKYEYLKKMVQAEIVTNYTVDFIIEGTERTGIIEIRRKLLDQSNIKLNYLSNDEFESRYLNNEDLTSFYTIDSQSNIVIVKTNKRTTTYPDNSTTTESEFIKESIPYRNLVAQYTMPFEYTFALMQTTMNPEYVSKVTDLALQESKIVFTIFDCVGRRTTVTEEEYRERYFQETVSYDDEENPTSTTRSDYSYSGFMREWIKTEVEEINTIISGITSADTWLYKKEIEYVQTESSQTEESSGINSGDNGNGDNGNEGNNGDNGNGENNESGTLNQTNRYGGINSNNSVGTYRNSAGKTFELYVQNNSFPSQCLNIAFAIAGSGYGYRLGVVSPSSLEDAGIINYERIDGEGACANAINRVRETLREGKPVVAYINNGDCYIPAWQRSNMAPYQGRAMHAFTILDIDANDNVYVANPWYANFAGAEGHPLSTVMDRIYRLYLVKQ